MKDSSQASAALRRSLPLLGVFLLPLLAQAHPGLPGHTHGFANGLAHPLTGLDHVLAMVAVGVWAAQRGGRALWLVPTTFVSIMVIGGMLGMGGAGIPCVEQGIAASVLVLGIFIAAAVRLPLAASAAIVGLFALFHGFAHGAEMPATVSSLDYGVGFLLMTSGLHLCGISFGLIAKQWGSKRMVRHVGVAVAACGLYLCFVSCL